MKETRFYTCQYCCAEFIPKRRRVQKYCSDSCRSSAYQLRKKTQTDVIPLNHLNAVTESVAKTKDEISVAKIASAAAGNLIADGAKAIFTSKENKPATKGDIDELLQKLKGKRYYLINNLEYTENGYPYFDIENNEVVYYKYKL